ncbi:hypothetical protein PENTCL1PPCAC_14010, partial [Pristionchus entomophagus]
LLSTLALAASALDDITVAPPLECANITIKSAGNCPKKGYVCDEGLEIQYNVLNEDGPTVECVDQKAKLAVRNKIVGQVQCRDGKWHAEGGSCGCCFTTTSVVCARDCGITACPAYPPRNPNNFEMHIEDATESTQCAVAKCQYGFVALDAEGSVIAEFRPTANVTCTGNGEWNVNGKQTFSYVMCKNMPKPCTYKCNDEPWQIKWFKQPTLPANRDGCEYSCPAGEALSRRNGTVAITVSTATCTARGILTDNGVIAEQIGCSTCDVPDGPVVRPIDPMDCNNKPGISTKCVLRCPAGYELRYTIGPATNNCAKFLAPGNVLYRLFRSSDNSWITRDGFVLTSSFRYDCVKRF